MSIFIDFSHRTHETFAHFLGLLGTGVYSLPYVYNLVGFWNGILLSFLTFFIVYHAVKIILDSAHKLYKKTKRPAMTYPEILESAIKLGPPKFRKYSKLSRQFLTIIICITYLGTCSVCMVMIGEILRHLFEVLFKIDLSVRETISLILIPTILLCLIPNLKYLAPFSALANIFNFIAIFGVFYYCLKDVSKLQIHPVKISFSGVSDFLGVALYSMNCMGILIPIENQIEDPNKFFGHCGILNIGMFAMLATYLSVGMFGFLRYGNDIEESIILNLPIDKDFAIVSFFMLMLATFFPIGIDFYVVFEAFWLMLEDHIEKHVKLIKISIRFTLIGLIYLMAITIPIIGALMGLIGAIGYTLMDLICPPLIHLLVLYNDPKKYGKFHWIFWKNILMLLFGTYIFIFGTFSTIRDIIKTVYLDDNAEDMSLPFARIYNIHF
jgi:solute carrier family 36 (proton-coupled amino acid transporter)